MARLIGERYWRQTPLGPIEEWPDALVQALEMILHSQFQLAVYWGPELTLLYNDAERVPLGDLHPEALGQPARVVLRDIWDDVGPMLESVLTTGQPTWSEDAPLTLRRSGMNEEAYFTWSYSPLVGESGRPEGVLLISTETTSRVLSERRLRGLYAVATRTANQHSLDEVWRESVEALAEDPDIFLAELHTVTGGAPVCIASAARGGSNPGRRASARSIAEAALSGEAVVERPGLKDADACTALLIPFKVGALAGAATLLALYLDPRRRVEEGALDYARLLAGQIAAAASDAATVERDRTRLRNEAVGEERKRIERDLHDSIQRQLVGARLVTELTRDLVAEDPVRVDRLLVELSAQLSSASAELRQIVAGQYPSLLGTRGLVAAVRAAAERASLPIEIEGEVARADESVEHELYYAIVEAVQNAFKHGGPECRVGVRFRRKRDRMVVLVFDSGSGFDEASVVAGRGMGNMRDRLAAVGGSCRVRSALGRGTSVRFTSPCAAPGGAAAAGESAQLARTPA